MHSTVGTAVLKAEETTLGDMYMLLDVPFNVSADNVSHGASEAACEKDLCGDTFAVLAYVNADANAIRANARANASYANAIRYIVDAASLRRF